MIKARNARRYMCTGFECALNLIKKEREKDEEDDTSK